MICKYCGRENRAGIRFCGGCGKALTESAGEAKPEEMPKEEQQSGITSQEVPVKDAELAVKVLKSKKPRNPLVIILPCVLLATAVAALYLLLRGTPVKEITFADRDLRLTEGKSKVLSYQVIPADSDDLLTWTSSDEHVASVDADGKVTAVAEGTCVITVQAESGCKTACYLVVSPPLREEEASAVGQRTLFASTVDGKVKYIYGKSDTLSLYTDLTGHLDCPDGSYHFTWRYTKTSGSYQYYAATLDDKSTATLLYNIDSGHSLKGTVAVCLDNGNIWVFH